MSACIGGAVGVGEVDASPAGDGAARERVSLSASCEVADAGCGATMPLGALCGSPDVLFNNVPLTTGATGPIDPDIFPPDSNWFTEYVGVNFRTDRPEITNPVDGQPSSCAAPLSGAVATVRSGTYSVVQGGTYGDVVVVELHDVVLDAGPDHDITVNLLRVRTLLIDPPTHYD